MTTIERMIDKNTKEVFQFWFDDRNRTLYLDVYQVLVKASPRHKFRTLKQYSRLEHRTYPTYNAVKLEDVPLTEEIKKQALDKFVSEIKVNIWKD